MNLFIVSTISCILEYVFPILIKYVSIIILILYSNTPLFQITISTTDDISFVHNNKT